MWGRRGSSKKDLSNVEQLEKELADLRAWKARAEAVLDKIQVQNLELSGEVQTSVRKASEISHRSHAMKARMASFESHFEDSTHVMNEMEGAITSLTGGVTATHSAISQTSAAIEEITASIVRISEVSTSRLTDIHELELLAKNGQKEMSSTLQVMDEVTKGIDDLMSFLSVINTIAGQTRILAMNAAIQAAHAGEYGRSFAVVADEVRLLAETSSANAGQINKRLKTWIGSIRKAETSSGKTAQLLTEVENKTTIAAGSFHEIEQGARELAAGSREILQSISDLREVAQATTSDSARLSEGSQALNQHLSQLQDEESQLKNEINQVREAATEANSAATTLTQSTIHQLSTAQEQQLSSSLALGSTSANGRVTVLVLQHLALLTRIRGVLDGSVRLLPEQVTDHHQCDLGHWMDSEGQNLLDRTAFQELNTEHERLHALARDITRLVQQDRTSEGEALFENLYTASGKLVALIHDNARQLGVTDLVTWSKDLELGIPIFDTQHKKLVEILNKLNRSFQRGGSRQELAGILDELTSYTVTHFQDEERLFTKTTYPETAKHLAQHQNFVQQVQQFRQAFQAGTGSVGSEILLFLKNWLIEHIKGTDRGYIAFIKPEKGGAA
ncbi:MAG: bacteriohemerythrin [Spirochaetales bacterium]|nr:bacteriohemerythrin [Spirochaetales bacterium]